MVHSKVQNLCVTILGSARLIRFQPCPDTIDHGLPPNSVVFRVGNGRIKQIARWQGLELSTSEMIDDQPVENCSKIISKTAFGVVSTCKFMCEELGPEFLENFIGEIWVSKFQA